jgi:aspartate aminotransferase
MGVLDCSTPGGAFYVYPSCSGTFGLTTPDGKTIQDDASFCEYLLDYGRVALVPGRAFGLPGYFRLSYAYTPDEFKEGCRRIADAVAALL